MIVVQCMYSTTCTCTFAVCVRVYMYGTRVVIACTVCMYNLRSSAVTLCFVSFSGGLMSSDVIIISPKVRTALLVA